MGIEYMMLFNSPLSRMFCHLSDLLHAMSTSGVGDFTKNVTKYVFFRYTIFTRGSR